jgi:ferrous iron transport protein B
MPLYKWPLWKNVFYTVVEKTRSFVYGAGKIILAISIVLWFLGSNGFSENFRNAENLVTQQIAESGFSKHSTTYIADNLALYREELSSGNKTIPTIVVEDSLSRFAEVLRGRALRQEIASYKLEHSLIGQMGKVIEPLVQPLGYDWKIGIAVLTSFAAREVFVGTLATIYSVGSDEENTIKNRMAAELREDNGEPLFNLASGVSLLLFYAFAMQCMSTLAVVKRETNSWKWPVIQFTFMGLLAYLTAFIAYQILI